MISDTEILERLDEMGGHLFELRKAVGERLLAVSSEDVVAAARAAGVGDDVDPSLETGARREHAPVAAPETAATETRHRRG